MCRPAQCKNTNQGVMQLNALMCCVLSPPLSALQSITVDRQMKRYSVPRLVFINKLDRMVRAGGRGAGVGKGQRTPPATCHLPPVRAISLQGFLQGGGRVGTAISRYAFACSCGDVACVMRECLRFHVFCVAGCRSGLQPVARDQCCEGQAQAERCSSAGASGAGGTPQVGWARVGLGLG